MRLGGLTVALLAVGALLGLSACGGGGGGPRDIAFVSTRSGVYDIYSMTADGKHQRRMTTGKHGDPANPESLFYAVDPAWSPDGTKIAFASRRDGTFDIFTMDADGKNAQAITSGKGEDTHPTWSPDGKQIAFIRGSFVFEMSADGKGAHRITRGGGVESDPAWSPDGTWIAYVDQPTGMTAKEIWLVRPDGSTGRTLTKLHESSNGPSWSPDAKRLVFSTDAGGGDFKIAMIGVDGKGYRVIVEPTSDAVAPAWSPEGSTIAYSEDGAIHTVTPAGKDVTTLTDPKNNDSSPAWNPVPAPAKS